MRDYRDELHSVKTVENKEGEREREREDGHSDGRSFTFLCRLSRARRGRRGGGDLSESLVPLAQLLPLWAGRGDQSSASNHRDKVGGGAKAAASYHGQHTFSCNLAYLFRSAFSSVVKPAGYTPIPPPGALPGLTSPPVASQTLARRYSAPCAHTNTYSVRFKGYNL